MAIRLVRLGTPRAPGEGLRLGTVRQPPRGVRREDHARLDYYDLWLPDLAPSAALLAYARTAPLTGESWKTFSRRYRREMSQPGPRRILALLAALSAQANFSVGCYCAEELHCHRSVLRALLSERGANIE